MGRNAVYSLARLDHDGGTEGAAGYVYRRHAPGGDIARIETFSTFSAGPSSFCRID